MNKVGGNGAILERIGDVAMRGTKAIDRRKSKSIHEIEGDRRSVFSTKVRRDASGSGRNSQATIVTRHLHGIGGFLNNIAAHLKLIWLQPWANLSLVTTLHSGQSADSLRSVFRRLAGGRWGLLGERA